MQITSDPFKKHDSIQLAGHYMTRDGLCFEIYTGIIKRGNTGEGNISSFSKPKFPLQHSEFTDLMAFMKQARDKRSNGDPFRG
jgi:hypothetical protein